jgi:hypothetical protein
MGSADSSDEWRPGADDPDSDLSDLEIAAPPARRVSTLGQASMNSMAATAAEDRALTKKNQKERTFKSLVPSTDRQYLLWSSRFDWFRVNTLKQRSAHDDPFCLMHDRRCRTDLGYQPYRHAQRLPTRAIHRWDRSAHWPPDHNWGRRDLRLELKGGSRQYCEALPLHIQGFQSYCSPSASHRHVPFPALSASC